MTSTSVLIQLDTNNILGPTGLRRCGTIMLMRNAVTSNNKKRIAVCSAVKPTSNGEGVSDISQLHYLTATSHLEARASGSS